MPYRCKTCSKSFTFQQTYRKHLLYHSNDKPYCCAQCGRLFKELSTLHNHERIHSGEKPFTCETCGRFSYLLLNNRVQCLCALNFCSFNKKYNA